MLKTRFREQMPVVDKWIYLDHAAVGPLPTPSKNAISKWLQQASESGDAHWLEWLEQTKQLRNTASRMINAKTSELALMPSTTAGINLVSEGLPWQPGDNVVTLANEFPSNLFPWQLLEHRGVEVRLVETDNGRVDLQRIDDACDAKTRLVSVSWVGYASGYRCCPSEVAEVVHKNNALLMLDAIQGLGVFPLDVAKSNVDFLAADGHKWMLGPEGAGLFYVKQEHLDKLRPIGIGWNSVVKSFDFASSKLELKPDASRYEGGTMNMGGFIGLNASLNLLTSLGVGPQTSQVADSVLETAAYAVQSLSYMGAKLISPFEPGHESGIVTFTLAGQVPEVVRNRCLKHGIVLSCRGGGIRISVHGYTTFEDIDRLIEILKLQD